MSQAGVQNKQAWIDLSAIVGPDHLRAAKPKDAVDSVQPDGVIAPGTAQEVAQVLQYCASAGLGVIPRGGGSQLGLGNRPRKADFILSLERLNQVIEHAWGDMTVTVEAGCAIDKLQSVLREHGQQLGADPMYPEQATVGGVLATAESGTLRIRYGAIRDLVLGVEMALPDGSVIKAGGKVVKNVAGYDLTKLVIGSLGTLGIITRAVFRLHPVPVAVAPTPPHFLQRRRRRNWYSPFWIHTWFTPDCRFARAARTRFLSTFDSRAFQNRYRTNM
jgi:glycolate oxidase FAD binding subunit